MSIRHDRQPRQSLWGARAGGAIHWLGTAALAMAPAALFYPGLLNADSLNIYGNALAGGPASDWHSAFLVLLWRGLLRLGCDVAALTLLHCAIYMLALFSLLARAGARPATRLAIAALVLVTPPTLTWLAALEKTTIAGCLLAACFAVAVALEATPRRRGLLALLLALALAGTWTRHNAILLFAPVVVDALWRHRPRVPITRAAILAGFLALAVGAPMLGAALGVVERRHAEQELFALDLMNLSAAAGRDLLPPGTLTVPFAAAAQAMQAQPDPPFGGRFSVVALRRNGMLPRIRDANAAHALRAAWWDAVASEPARYVRYRLALFRAFNCFDPSLVCLDSWHWYTGGIDHPNRFGLAGHAQPAVFAFYRRLAGSVFYRPYCHALLTLGLFALAVWRRRGPVAAYAAILLANYLSLALIAPVISVRLAVPLGLMAPALAIGLFTARPRQP